MPRPITSDDPADRSPVLVSTQEAARLLGLSRNQIYVLLNRGDIESRYIGQRRQVLMTSLNEFIATLSTERGA